MTEYRWLLPSVLLGDGQDGRTVRRSTRDWFVDIVIFALCAFGTLALLGELQASGTRVSDFEQLLAALACVAVWLRRRWPVGLCLVLTVITTYFILAGPPAAVALFTVAVHRAFNVSGPILLLNLLTVLPSAQLRPDPTLPFWVNVGITEAALLAIFAWGMVVRARRQLVWSLRAQADKAAEEARRLERERIAREMHDVLAHRISILSLHAGALEFRPDAPAEEISRAAGAIRGSAHQALQDLREVIGVLRAGDAEEPTPERPQPTLDDLPGLVAECRQAGMRVELEVEAGEVPERVGRDAYRIVQEALTNARKHAPEVPVSISVGGVAGQGLGIRVRNRLPARAGRGMGIPGSGSGLIGLTERASLLGGRLSYGPTPGGEFEVEAWLPWKT
ncbi:sensor histidine kinase [Nonomuraea soli]|uniref:histidine kinase n=1 Tax=Nonomuraea soli TaxID=1032476 RepID=A0A7W0CEG1_9ACTN|nr:histidine kinase [Nonomuraea soli]MBA2889490.1 signal transduction histidine kinase [Nonomuraea soli]